MKKKKARKVVEAAKRGPKVASRKAAKTVVKTIAVHKKIQLPDHVTGKFCIAKEDESFLVASGLYAKADDSDATEVVVFDTKEAAKARIENLKTPTVASDGSGHEDAAALPLKLYFANHYSMDEFNFILAVSLRPKGRAVPLKTAVSHVRKEIKAEIAASLATMKALGADVAKAEKDLKAFNFKMAKYGI